MADYVPQPLSEQHRAVMCDCDWLSNCPSDFQEGLMKTGALMKFEPGYVLHKRGVAPNFVHRIVEGETHMTFFGPENQEIVVPAASPARWIPLAEVVAGIASGATSVVKRPSLLFRVARGKLLALLDEKPTRYRHVIEYEIYHRRRSEMAILTLATAASSDQVVGRRLLTFLEVDQFRVGTKISMSQAAWAQAAGLSPAAVQRAFRKMRRLGIIETSYPGFMIKDRHLLENFVEENDRKNSLL